MERLNRLIAEYAEGREIDPKADLMASPVLMPIHSMAALFLNIEKEFEIDLNKLIPALTVYSPDEIAGKLDELCSQK